MPYIITITESSPKALAFVQYAKKLDFVEEVTESKDFEQTVPPIDDLEEDEYGIPIKYREEIMAMSKESNRNIAKRWREDLAKKKGVIDLSNYRKTYDKRVLLESEAPENPMQLFQTWFYDADESDSVDEANAMSVSTIGLDGYPKTRVVLLKQYTYEGFIFYTNYQSEKGKAILANPHLCLSFSGHLSKGKSSSKELQKEFLKTFLMVILNPVRWVVS